MQLYETESYNINLPIIACNRIKTDQSMQNILIRIPGLAISIKCLILLTLSTKFIIYI